MWRRYEDSILVFEGDYSNPDSLLEMLDLVLGLYAMVLRSKETTTAQLHNMIVHNHARIFPVKYFGTDLTTIMERIVNEDEELRQMADKAAAVNRQQTFAVSKVKPLVVSKAGSMFLKLRNPSQVAPADFKLRTKGKALTQAIRVTRDMSNSSGSLAASGAARDVPKPDGLRSDAPATGSASGQAARMEAPEAYSRVRPTAG